MQLISFFVDTHQIRKPFNFYSEAQLVKEKGVCQRPAGFKEGGGEQDGRVEDGQWELSTKE